MNEEEKRLFDEDMEKYGITFEEWIVKMEEIAEEVEREYYKQEELNINSSMEEIMKVVDELTEGVEVLEDFEIDDYKYEEPFILLTKEELEELVSNIKKENYINIFTSEDNNINKRNFYMLKEFVKSIKGE